MIKTLAALATSIALVFATPIVAETVVDKETHKIERISVTEYKLTGQMTPLAFLDLNTAIHDTNAGDVNIKVSLSSGGGNQASLAASKMFRLFNNVTFEVEAGNQCMSMCAYILLISDDFEMENGAIVGLHNVYRRQMNGDETPQQFGDMYSMGTVAIGADMLEAGYSFRLHQTIVNKTTPGSYLVFFSADKINEWRYVGALGHPEEPDSTFTLMSNADILALVKTYGELKEE